MNMVVITVGEWERAQVLVRLAVRNKHTLASWMAPRLQMGFRDISLLRINQRYWGVNSCPAQRYDSFIKAVEYDSH